ncbi:type II toxin-antitoxin system MqsA family antitoxin [Endozoicomonas sp. SCSIO W0465]|uniref:type II toxin-antitoxin system MqsA family antitoxin n=1 Tax=Endozoicomonas sp. SCSIO W0465 TaxID=2918516 RepID=UPI002112E9F8|nr:type II toxin-antitoxin system MqsA family antitoxin [Endozoicomonas sp. SCSIO W0465]
MSEWHCELCGEPAVRDTRPMEYEYKGRTITLDQPGIYCDSCGESMLYPEDLDATRVAIMDFHARIDDILGPSAVKSIRKFLNKTQKQLSDILGGGANAFSRYERGITPVPKSTSVALTLMAKHPEDVETINNHPLYSAS